LGAAFVAAVSCGAGSSHQAAEPAGDEWKLVWSDEFDGTDVDPTKWDFDLGNGPTDANGNVYLKGWGNDELEYYTREPENVFVKEGMLHVRALKKSHQGSEYTSARLKTRKRDGGPLFNKTYGKFEFRAKLPTGKGIWPALWMMPQSDKYGGWAASGEIDVMEARGQEPNKVLGTLHFGSSWPANAHSERNYVLPDAGTIADFHLYTLEWEPGEMRWLVDGKPYATQSFWWSSSKREQGRGAAPAGEGDINPWPAPFDQPFHIIMNVAVGGKFLGNPDATTAFPVDMVVDYVRVYDKTAGYGKTKPRGEGNLPFDKR
jgi:beta-glucanase (GH16 family)